MANIDPAFKKGLKSFENNNRAVKKIYRLKNILNIFQRLMYKRILILMKNLSQNLSVALEKNTKCLIK